MPEPSAIFGMAVDLARFRSGLDQSVGLARGAARRIEGVFTSLSNPFAALGVGAAAAGLGILVHRAFDLADSLDEMATRTGVGVVALQELQHAARQTGAGVEGLENGLRFLNKNLSEAAIGKKEAVEIFAELGIAATDSAGNVRPVTEVLGDVADKMAAMENPADRVRVAITLFGRAGTALIPMLDRGRAGLAEFRAEAHRLGLVLDESMVKEASKAKDELDALAAAIKVNATRAVIQFTPEILELAASFNTLLAGLKNVAEFFGKDQFVGIVELQARLNDARRELEALSTSAFTVDPVNRDAQAKRVAELEALLAKREAAARPVADKSKKSGLNELPDVEDAKKLEARLKAVREQLLGLAVPDPVMKSMVQFRLETEDLAKAFTRLGDIDSAKSARAFGAGIDEALQKQLALKNAITDTQAAQAGQSLGIADKDNPFAAFAKIDEIRTEAGRFGAAIDGLVKRGVPLGQVFTIIGKAQDALSLKIANLREQFPDLAETIRTELGELDFGGFQKTQDAIVRGAAGVTQGIAGIKDEAGKITPLWDGMRSSISSFIDTSEGINRRLTPALRGTGAAVAGIQVAIDTSLIPAASDAVQSFVVLTDYAEAFRFKLAQLEIQVARTAASIAVAGRGNF